MNQQSLTYIDLFAGAGGLSEGFNRQNFEAIAHVEMNKSASETLITRLAFYCNQNNKMYNSYLKGEIKREDFWNTIPKEILDSVINEEINEKTIVSIFNKIDNKLKSRKVDVIIGGPPCQAYSLVGRSRDPNKMKGDNRNYLYRYYAKFLIRYKPKYFVFENVIGLLSAGNKNYFKELIALFTKIGYSVEYKILNAEDFGVLQKRRRVIIIGKRGKSNFLFPQLSILKNDWQIMRDLFNDLPSLIPGQEMSIVNYLTKKPNTYLSIAKIRNHNSIYTTQHFARKHNIRDLEIYNIAIKRWLNKKERLKYNDLPKNLQTHKNTSAFLDRYKVVDPFGHSHTIVAHISKDGHYYIYPDKNQIRSISVREAARIQSFPDDYFFEGGRTSAYKQIGNAVPPLMAEAIAKALKELI